MVYKLEQLSAGAWQAISPQLKDMWRTIAVRRGWPQTVCFEGVAFSESRDSWLSPAPVFLRDRPASWYFFHFKQETYCFRIFSQRESEIEFFDGEPSPVHYENFKQAVKEAFAAFGFYGSLDCKSTFTPDFPPLKKGGVQ